MGRPFHFRLEPVLRRGRDRQHRCAREYRAAIEQVREEQRELEQIRVRNQTSEQQITAAHDKLHGDGTTEDLAVRHARLLLLEEQLTAGRAAEGKQLSQVRFAEQQTLFRREEWLRARAEVKALEKLRERVRERHEVEERRREDLRQDDAAILWFQSRRRAAGKGRGR